MVGCVGLVDQSDDEIDAGQVRNRNTDAWDIIWGYPECWNGDQPEVAVTTTVEGWNIPHRCVASAHTTREHLG